MQVTPFGMELMHVLFVLMAIKFFLPKNLSALDSGCYIWSKTAMPMSVTPKCIDIVCVVTHHQLSIKSELIKYLHQCACSPVPSSWLKAIDKRFLLSYPGLTSATVTEYLLPATTNGHIKTIRKNCTLSTFQLFLFHNSRQCPHAASNNNCHPYNTAACWPCKHDGGLWKWCISNGGAGRNM